MFTRSRFNAPWEPEEDDRLLRVLAEEPPPPPRTYGKCYLYWVALGEKFGRSPYAVEARARTLRVAARWARWAQREARKAR